MRSRPPIKNLTRSAKIRQKEDSFAGSHDVNAAWSYRMSLTFQSVAPGHYFEFDPDCVLDGNYGARLEFKCGEH